MAKGVRKTSSGELRKNVRERHAPVGGEPALEAGRKAAQIEEVDQAEMGGECVHRRVVAVELPGMEREDSRQARVAEEVLAAAQPLGRKHPKWPAAAHRERAAETA